MMARLSMTPDNFHHIQLQLSELDTKQLKRLLADIQKRLQNESYELLSEEEKEMLQLLFSQH